jgi:DNA helicase-2/ATP-dependent DNA helicase PcrA
MAQFKQVNPAMFPPALLGAWERMNNEQRRVATLDGGMAAIIGVPGAGKTRALINLIARMAWEGINPQKILAMTFTRNAANEMNDRLGAMSVGGARVGTIHSVCRQILIQETDVLESVQLDEKNRLDIELKKTMADARRSGKLPRYGVDKEWVGKFMAACKSRGACFVAGNPFGLNAALEYGVYEMADEFAQLCGVQKMPLYNLYLEVEKRRAGRNLYSFDDMLLWAWCALISSPDARSRWRGKWSHIIVDEVQDSNPIQWDLARMLAGLDSCILRKDTVPQNGTASNYLGVADQYVFDGDDHPRSLYVFGDPSQSLYKFREAVPELFVEFTEREDVEVVALPLNYRSAPGICALSTELVKDKTWHLAGEMHPAGPLAAMDLAESVPMVVGYDGAELEASAAVQWACENAESSPGGLNDACIMSRMSVALHLAEIECIRRRIPYRKMAGGSFFEEKVIRDVLSYVRVAAGLDHDGRQLRRIINIPFRFIGNAYIQDCEYYARENSVSLLDAMIANEHQLRTRQRSSLHSFCDLLQELNMQAVKAEETEQEAAAPPAPGRDQDVEHTDDAQMQRVYSGPAAMLATMLDATKYISELRKEEGLGTDDAKRAMLGELQRMAELFRSPVKFIEYVDQLAAAVKEAKASGLKQGTNSATPALTLSTIHRAKGLEWTYVWVMDLAEKRFPHHKNRDQDEELRLLYVAITRAKARCILSHPGGSDPDFERLTSSFVPLLRELRSTVTGVEDC